MKDATSFATPGSISARGATGHNRLPVSVDDLKKIKTLNGAKIRYKEPSICETTPGVRSFSGYIDLDEDKHVFFWFFESRKSPESDPVTLWLNGGPGADSLIGLYQELGPCNVSEDLISHLNPYSWTEESNFLFLSQPLGAGFSYAKKGPGSINEWTGSYQDPSIAEVEGRFAIIDPSKYDTTDRAAVVAWEALQAFYGALPQLDAKVTSREFNLWTESYGGHYGPSFFRHFQKMNRKIKEGLSDGIPLSFGSLGIGNGVIDEYIQAAYYAEFAVNNTYGIKAYNDSIYENAVYNYNRPNGCEVQIGYCRSVDPDDFARHAVCSAAQNMCRDNVEAMYYYYSGRGIYDIRHPQNDTEPPYFYVDYLNKAEVQYALGVDVNYTSSNYMIYNAFQQSGDMVYRTFIKDLGEILDSGVRVVLYYGDADYICNWYGGQAVSLAVNYTHDALFRSAGYVPFLVDGVEYGEVREAGNFTFLRIYEAGHAVPYYQPKAALEMFRRSLLGLDMAEGTQKVTPTLTTKGNATATHTETFYALATTDTTVL
ncbi:hypothetical protein AFLA70_151g001881 [Aspergillus flavus AF70]|nr:hypothetical protein AFLA70_151g001881 [Aspergillus flavus AF70]